MLKRFLRQSKSANRLRKPASSLFAKLKLEQLEARDVPALWAVHLWSPGAGEPGDTAAIHSGSLAANAALPTNSNGDTLVEANSIQEAVGLALVGTITVQHAGQTLNYSMAPGNVGATIADHKPFLVSSGGAIQFEDMAGSATGSDWDYNDRYWIGSAAEVPGGGTTSPPYPPPPPPSVPPSPPYPPPPPPPPAGAGLYAVRLITPGTGGGDLTNSLAEFSGQLMLDQKYPSLPQPGSEQRILVNAPSALEAARLALTGTIYARLEVNGQPTVMEHSYAALTVAYDKATAKVNQWSYFIEAIAPTPAGANFQVNLEDSNPLAAPTPNDQDYNDRFWQLKVDAIAEPLVKLEVTDPLSVGWSSLKVGKWENAFNAPAAGGVPTLKNDFIGLDPDCFRVRLTDKTTTTNNTPGIETRTVHVVTTVDGGSDVTLTETAGDTGVFLSKTLLLVSNGADNKYAVDGILDTAALGDRTFEVRLGNDVSFGYFGNGIAANAIEKRETVPVWRYVDVNVTVMRAKPAAGEMELGPDHRGDETRGYLTKAEALTETNFAKEQYAQVGIQLRFVNGIQFAEQPAGVDLSDSLNIGMTKIQGEMIAEQKALYSGISTRTPATDDIELIFVSAVFAWDYVNANWVQNDFIAAVATPIDIAPRVGDLPDNTVADTISISVQHSTAYTIAHEIGHILTQKGHAKLVVPAGDTFNYAVPIPALNLMESGDAVMPAETIADQTIYDAKRLLASQAERISIRPNLLKKL